RWWWHSRGYTPAGVECWNGIRGIDYLLSRPDVDAGRLAVTGISGGGAATFWIAAADERVQIAAPVSGMADLLAYVPNRVINGHCDCMFSYNTYRWPWTRIAALIAPRPLLFANSDQDRIFPMDANERIINRLERVYSLHGASDAVDGFVRVGGHAYREDLRRGIFRFINLRLKNDPRAVADSEVDLVAGSGNQRKHPIDPVELRVFPADSDLPADELNTTIDRVFVPLAKVAVPKQGEFDQWKRGLTEQLREVSFGATPARIPPAKLLEQTSPTEIRLETELGIRVRLQYAAVFKPTAKVKRVLLVVVDEKQKVPFPEWLHELHQPGDAVYLCESRGIGWTKWTRKNPPNYVERSHVLLGRTVDTGRVWDAVAAARFLREKHGETIPVHATGEGAAGVIAAYAALWEPEIEGVAVHRPPLSHMESDAPQFLNALRVCDVPDVFGMLAPRPLTISGRPTKTLSKTTAIYQAAGAGDALTVRPE
ncbi:MAG: prolyl oligopeptidase family serine peptidase, partial [Planctomycetales bacterium]